MIKIAFQKQVFKTFISLLHMSCRIGKVLRLTDLITLRLKVYNVSELHREPKLKYFIKIMQIDIKVSYFPKKYQFN